MPDLIPAWLSNILGKEPTVKIMFTVVIFLALITFVPLDLFPNHPMPEIGFYIGMIGLAFLLAHTSMNMYSKIIALANEYKVKKSAKAEADRIYNVVHTLTDDEAQMVVDFIEMSGTQSYCPKYDAVYNQLIDKGVFIPKMPHRMMPGYEIFSLNPKYRSEIVKAIENAKSRSESDD